MKKTVFLLWLMTISATALYGDVYSLWPFHGNPASSGMGNGEGLAEKPFWTEPITVNGVSASMDISILDVSYADAVRALLAQYPQAKILRNANSMLLGIHLSNGKDRRIFLLSLAEAGTVLKFSMDVPAGSKEGKDSDWPKQVPLLPGSTEINVIQMTKRDSVLATCHIDGTTRAEVVSEMDSRLKSMGWTPATGELANLFQASGEVYFNGDDQVLLLGVAPHGNGQTMTVYTRKSDVK